MVFRLSEGGRVGNLSGNRRHHARIGPPSHYRGQLGGVDLHDRVIGCSRVCSQSPPLLDGGVEIGPLRRESSPPQILESGVVGGDHPGPSATLDTHVAHRHAPIHGHGTYRLAGVLDDVANTTLNPDLADDVQDQVLGADAEGQRPVDPDFHGLWLKLAQRLGSQHVLHFSRADAYGQSPQGPVGGGVAVAANNSLPRLGISQVRTDYVNDALERVEPVV